MWTSPGTSVPFPARSPICLTLMNHRHQKAATRPLDNAALNDLRMFARLDLLKGEIERVAFH